MDDVFLNKMREVVDHHEIVSCLHRYCRGLDRFDRELMLSAYHSDAIDDHGIVVLRAADFVDWAITHHRQHNLVHHHAITNIVAEIDGVSAHCECYWTYMGTTEERVTQLSFGRYIDRLEKRDGIWAIAARQCFTEASHVVPEMEMPEAFLHQLFGNGTRARSRDDTSYERPLSVERPLTSETPQAA